jgi:hypothetical protein
MLGDPIARKAQRLGMDGKVGGIGESLAKVAPFDDGDEIVDEGDEIVDDGGAAGAAGVWPETVMLLGDLPSV